MAVEILIDRATTFDAALMAALHASCFARPWDEAAMAQFIAGPDTLCLIGTAVDRSEVAPAGFLIARKAADEAELLTLGVAPACRRMGLARTLLGQACASLRASGAKQLLLEVEEGNEAALQLYRSLGAVPGWAGARAITSMAPTPRSSALPFQAAPPMMTRP